MGRNKSSPSTKSPTASTMLAFFGRTAPTRPIPNSRATTTTTTSGTTNCAKQRPATALSSTGRTGCGNKGKRKAEVLEVLMNAKDEEGEESEDEIVVVEESFVPAAAATTTPSAGSGGGGKKKGQKSATLEDKNTQKKTKTTPSPPSTLSRTSTHGAFATEDVDSKAIVIASSPLDISSSDNDDGDDDTLRPLFRLDETSPTPPPIASTSKLPPPPRSPAAEPLIVEHPEPLNEIDCAPETNGMDQMVEDEEKELLKVDAREEEEEEEEMLEFGGDDVEEWIERGGLDEEGEEIQPPERMLEPEEGFDEEAFGAEHEMDVEDEGGSSPPPSSSLEVVVTERGKGKADVCPVCSRKLFMLAEVTRDAHVNACLDGNPSLDATMTPRPSASSSSTGPAPPPQISSIFRRAPPPNTTTTTTTSPPKPLSRLSTVPSFHLPPTTSSTPSSTLDRPNAFTTLMSGNAESKQWKEAAQSENWRGRLPKGETRKVPFYKWVDGMEITVDAFKYGKIEGCKAYFLSHAHSDHYQNLSSSWVGGLVYCSKTTANLIKLKLNVPDKYLCPLPMNETVQVEGISVTLIDANHCPGSTIFLFEGPHTDPKSPFSKHPKTIKRYLHCGDFRASPAHLNHPAMVNKRIDICYLDTTYLNEKYCFPAQELVIDACADLVRSRVSEGDEGALYRTGGVEQVKQEGLMKGWLGGGVKKEVKGEEGDIGGEEDEKKGKKKERLLVCVGTYSIGKERIVKGIAHALKSKIYCDDRKLALLQAQEDPDLHALITRDPMEAQVHVVWLQDIQREKLQDYHAKYKTGFTSVLGLRPTGWTYRPESKGDAVNPSIAKILEREMQRKFSAAGMYPQRDSTPSCLAFGVPYSEHSSFFELTCFALSLNYTKMIPTVNIGSEASRKRMQLWFERWMQEKKRRADARIPRMVPYRNDNYW